jgi:branched-chain amino acid transport system substrate-binding protein
MKVKFLNPVFVVILMAAIIFSCSCSRPPETVDLGAFLGLSGSISVYGLSQKNGIDLAVNEINSGGYLGKNKLLNIVIADTGATIDGAVTAVNKLIKEDHVTGLIGPTLSSQALAADPLAQSSKIPVIGISNTVPGFTEMGDNIFRCSLPESRVVANTLDTSLRKYGFNSVGILWGSDDAFTISTYQAFRDAVRKNNLSITADKAFVKGESDFSTRLNEIISSQPEAILVSAFIQEANIIVKQLRSLGFKGIIIGGNGFNSTDLIKQSGDSAEGVITGTAWNINNRSSKNDAFIAAYKEAYGLEPDQFAAQSYTSVWLFAKAIHSIDKVDSPSIRNALLQIHNYDTPLGNFSFTADREPVHNSIVQVVHNGQFEILK